MSHISSGDKFDDVGTSNVDVWRWHDARMIEEDARTAALSSLAYSSVMLGAVLDLAFAMATEWADAKRRIEGIQETVVDDGAATTSSTMLTTSYYGRSRAEGRSLLEYRAYVELGLVLARQLSDVVSRTDSGFRDDVLACDLVGDPGFRLSGLPEGLRTRISKGSSVHLVHYEDPDGRVWPIASISDWAVETMTQFEARLAETKPESAAWYARKWV